jgi:FkbM family methyltransferase
VCQPDARIICIEADPQIASLLRRNVTENGRSNIRIVQCLAGPIEHPRVAFYPAPTAKFGMGSIGPQFSASPVKLTQRTLDDVLDKQVINDVDVVK